MKKFIVIGALVLLLTLLLAACSTPPAATPCPTAEPCPDCPACPESEACPECPACPEPVVSDVPFQDEWAGSPHNDAEAEAFIHWNEDDPAEVPTSCARCHSTQGYVEFVTTGEVTNAVPAPAGTIQCVACHNEATAVMDSVTFPQVNVNEETGEEEPVVITGLGPEARCMVCHQGRASKSTVDATIEQFGATDAPDAVPAPVDDANLGFINIHYFPAGATLYGTQAKGGYEYDGKTYDWKFRHVEGIDTCVGCHNMHTLQVRLETCQECHEGVASVEDLRNVRMQGSLADYDGDGDVEEGTASELEGLKEALYAAIQEYGANVAGTPIVYDPASYPYFFDDAGERYSTWTPRLLKAAYNYQMATKDPGAFAHNAKYMIQLVYDSIADLNENLGTIDMSAMHREDPGHFAGNGEPFRHWDEDGEVVAGCAKCHSASGLPQFIKEGTNVANPLSNGFMCTTCHNAAEWPALYVVDEVEFPSGAVLTFGEGEASNLCIECHQGRSSTVTVDQRIGDKPDDTIDEELSFSNIHYFAAGATLFGNDAKGAYQFADKEYKGQNVEHPLNKCKDCHNVHALEINIEACAACHASASDPSDPSTYRMDATDYDGDGDTTEGISAEIDAFAEQLYAAMQAYAEGQGISIVYDGASYPYYFDADGNRFASWTPNLLRAAYNYQYYQKDPGTFAHNPKYVLQVLYDSIEAVGGDVGGFTRP